MRRGLVLLALALSTGCDAILGLSARPEAPSGDAMVEGDAVVAFGDAHRDSHQGERSDGGSNGGSDATLDVRRFPDVGVPAHDGHVGCFASQVNACTGFVCDCTENGAPCAIGCTASPKEPDAGPSLSCGNAPLCSLDCGDNCTINCGNSTQCEGTTGADADVTCNEVHGTCSFTLGDNSGASCNGSGTCIVTCTGTCSVSCDLSDSCTLRCMNGMEGCSLDCGGGATACPDGITEVCGAATCGDAGS
jgi:hypothetical protein